MNGLKSNGSTSWQLMPMWKRLLADLSSMKNWELQFCHRQDNQVFDDPAKLTPSYPMLLKNPYPLICQCNVIRKYAITHLLCSLQSPNASL